MQSGWLQATRRGLHAVIRALTWVSGAAVIILLLMIVANVFGRYVFRQPLMGSLEVVEVALMVTVFFAIAYTEVQRAHINVRVVVDRFPRRAGSIVLSIMYFLAAIYFMVLAWGSGVLGMRTILPRIQESYILNIPLAPFMFVMALGVFLLGLEMLFNCFQPLPPPEEGKKEETM